MTIKNSLRFCILFLIFVLGISFISAVWDETTGVWHNAKDINVKLRDNTYTSLQIWIDSSPLEESNIPLSGGNWENSAHLVFHEATNIKVNINSTYYTLQNWIDKTNIKWADSNYMYLSWHDASEIKVVLSDRNLSLQEWIDEQIGQAEMKKIIKSGDIIALKHDTLGEYVSVASDSASKKIEDGLNVNKDAIIDDAQKFIIIKEGDNTGEIINYGDKVVLKSVQTGGEVKYKYKWLLCSLAFGEAWMHANKNNDVFCPNVIFRPNILSDDSQEGPVKTGDMVFFKDSSIKDVKSQYWDVDVAGPSYNPSHLGSLNRFNIYKSSTSTKCSSSNLGLCINEINCTSAGGYWYNGRCNSRQAPVCDESHLSACITNETCTSAGGYWYNGRCNTNPASETNQIRYSEIGRAHV